MLVKATGIGFDGVCVRHPGDLFEIKDGSTGSWFEPVEVEKQPAKKVAKQGSSDTSDLA